MQVTTQVREAARKVEHQPEARRSDAQGARARRAAARGRGEALHRRPVDDLRAVPGPARPVARAAARAQRDHRLQPVAGGLRSRPDRADPLTLGRLSVGDQRQAANGTGRQACSRCYPGDRHCCYTARVPKLTVTVITRNEAANIDAALASVAWADEIVVVDSDSTDDTVAIARRHTDARRSRGLARLQRAEELRRVARRRTTGSCRSTPTSGSRRSSPAEIQALLAAEPAAPRLSHAARHAAISGAGSAPPTGIPTTSCGSTIAAPAHGTAAACTSRSQLERRRPGQLRARAAALSPTATSRTTSRPSIATRRWRREQMARRRPRAVDRRRRRSIRRSPSCATTSCAAASATARAGLHHLGAELVLRVPEAREAVGAASQRLAPRPRDRSDADVLPPHRHRADLARRPEPGAADGARAAGARPPDDARRAPAGELRQRAQEGLELDAAGAEDRDGSERGVAAVAAASSSCSPTSSTRTIRTASRWRRWRCR